MFAPIDMKSDAAQNLHSTFPGSVVDPTVTNFVTYTYHTYGTVRHLLPTDAPCHSLWTELHVVQSCVRMSSLHAK